MHWHSMNRHQLFARCLQAAQKVVQLPCVSGGTFHLGGADKR